MSELVRTDLTLPTPAVTISYAYNRIGLLEVIDGPRNDLADHVQLAYDVSGNLVERIDALGQRHSYQHGRSLDATGAIIERGHLDRLGPHRSVVRIPVPSVSTDFVSYAPVAGQLFVPANDVPETPPPDEVVIDLVLPSEVDTTKTLLRNGFGLPVVAYEPSRGRIEYDYDEAQNLVRETVQFGNDIETTFDALSRPTRVVRAFRGHYETTFLRYDDCPYGAGRLCQIDSPTVVVTFQHGDSDKLSPTSVEVRDKASGTVEAYEIPGGALVRPITYSVVPDIDDVSRHAQFSEPQGSTDSRLVGRSPLTAAEDLPSPEVSASNPHSVVDVTLFDEPYSRPRIAMRGDLNTDLDGSKLDIVSGLTDKYPPSAIPLGTIALDHVSDETTVEAFPSLDCSGYGRTMRLGDAVRTGMRSYKFLAGRETIILPGGVAVTVAIYVCVEIRGNRPPGEGLSRPGMCSWDRWNELQADVNQWCHPPRGCDGDSSCDAIEESITHLKNCIGARKTINSTCFRGGNLGHQQALQDSVNALVNCQKFQSKCR